jgi:lysophospholipase L1-like esterase
MLLKQGQKLVMIGDSITDCERARPRGEGLFGAIGKGYVALVEAQLNERYPERRVRVVNMGTSGNTVRDLAARWETDVIELKPDWLSIMIGINDVWRQFDVPTIVESHVGIEEYEATLEGLISRTKPHVEGLVLMTPFYIEPNKDDAMRAAMDRYGAVAGGVRSADGAHLPGDARVGPGASEYDGARRARAGVPRRNRIRMEMIHSQGRRNLRRPFPL